MDCYPLINNDLKLKIGYLYVIKLTVRPNGLQISTAERVIVSGNKVFVQIRLYFIDSFEYSKMLVC